MLKIIRHAKNVQAGALRQVGTRTEDQVWTPLL